MLALCSLPATSLPGRLSHPPATRLAAAHLLPEQVLLALGPSRSFKELKDRRWYFLIDLLSPWAALVAAASTSRSGAGLGWARARAQASAALLLDYCCCLRALLALPAHPHNRRSLAVSAALLRLPLLALLAGHALLHAFYIATWHSSRHTDRVIQLSSSDAKRRFSGGRYGAAELAWYHAGVLLDLLTHGTMVTLLLRGSGGGASTGGSGGV